MKDIDGLRQLIVFHVDMFMIRIERLSTKDSSVQKDIEY